MGTPTIAAIITITDRPIITQDTVKPDMGSVMAITGSHVAVTATGPFIVTGKMTATETIELSQQPVAQDSNK